MYSLYHFGHVESVIVFKTNCLHNLRASRDKTNLHLDQPSVASSQAIAVSPIDPRNVPPYVTENPVTWICRSTTAAHNSRKRSSPPYTVFDLQGFILRPFEIAQ